MNPDNSADVEMNLEFVPRLTTMVPWDLMDDVRIDSDRIVTEGERQGANLTSNDAVIPLLCPPQAPPMKYHMTGSLNPSSVMWSYNILWFGPTVVRVDGLKRQAGAPPSDMVPHGKGIAEFEVGPRIVDEESSDETSVPFVKRRDDITMEYRGM